MRTVATRRTEELVTHLIKGESRSEERAEKHPALSAPFCPHVDRLENKLRERLGTKVQLRYRQGRGALEIRFFSDAELERLLQIIGVSVD